MIEKDNIQELLQEKLQSHEVTPPDAVWQNVSSSLSNVAATSGAAAGTSTLLKIAAAVIGVSGLGIATYFMVQDDIPTKEKTSSIQIEEEIESQETKTSEPENKVIEIEENENLSVIETPDFNQPESIVEEIAVEEESIVLQENELELQKILLKLFQRTLNKLKLEKKLLRTHHHQPKLKNQSLCPQKVQMKKFKKCLMLRIKKKHLLRQKRK